MFACSWFRCFLFYAIIAVCFAPATILAQLPDTPTLLLPALSADPSLNIAIRWRTSLASATALRNCSLEIWFDVAIPGNNAGPLYVDTIYAPSVGQQIDTYYFIGNRGQTPGVNAHAVRASCINSAGRSGYAGAAIPLVSSNELQYQSTSPIIQIGGYGVYSDTIYGLFFPPIPANTNQYLRDCTLRYGPSASATNPQQLPFSQVFNRPISADRVPFNLNNLIPYTNYTIAVQCQTQVIMTPITIDWIYTYDRNVPNPTNFGIDTGVAITRSTITLRYLEPIQSIAQKGARWGYEKCVIDSYYPSSNLLYDTPMLSTDVSYSESNASARTPRSIPLVFRYSGTYQHVLSCRTQASYWTAKLGPIQVSTLDGIPPDQPSFDSSRHSFSSSRIRIGIRAGVTINGAPDQICIVQAYNATAVQTRSQWQLLHQAVTPVIQGSTSLDVDFRADRSPSFFPATSYIFNLTCINQFGTASASNTLNYTSPPISSPQSPSAPVFSTRTEWIQSIDRFTYNPIFRVYHNDRTASIQWCQANLTALGTSANDYQSIYYTSTVYNPSFDTPLMFTFPNSALQQSGTGGPGFSLYTIHAACRNSIRMGSVTSVNVTFPLPLLAENGDSVWTNGVSDEERLLWSPSIASQPAAVSQRYYVNTAPIDRAARTGEVLSISLRGNFEFCSQITVIGLRKSSYSDSINPESLMTLVDSGIRYHLLWAFNITGIFMNTQCNPGGFGSPPSPNPVQCTLDAPRGYYLEQGDYLGYFLNYGCNVRIAPDHIAYQATVEASRYGEFYTLYDPFNKGAFYLSKETNAPVPDYGLHASYMIREAPYQPPPDGLRGSSSSNSNGAAIGGAIGGVFGALILIAVGYYFYRQRYGSSTSGSFSFFSSSKSQSPSSGSQFSSPVPSGSTAGAAAASPAPRPAADSFSLIQNPTSRHSAVANAYMVDQHQRSKSQAEQSGFELHAVKLNIPRS